MVCSYCCSVAWLCLTLFDPMDCSTPDFPVLHYLLEFGQTYVHWVDDAIQPSNPLSPVPFSSCLQCFPAPRYFPMSQLFASGGQSTGASASATVLSMNMQGWFPLGLIGLISLQSKGLSRVFLNQSTKASIFQHSAFFTVQLSHSYMTAGNAIALTLQIFVSKVMALILNRLSNLS